METIVREVVKNVNGKNIVAVYEDTEIGGVLVLRCVEGYWEIKENGERVRADETMDIEIAFANEF